MLQGIRKKKQAAPTSASAPQAIVCGACQYTRQETDNNPLWQCPCCKSAYAKVNAEPEKRQEEQARLREAQETLKQAEAKSRQKKKLENTGVGLLYGTAKVLSGIGSTCARLIVVHSPAAVVIGSLIIVGSIIYSMSR